MNIIQIQDRLKGVDDQALVGYVENPTGEVPTYLALGELGRREEMRAKYQAQAQPTQTVAEEIIAKVAPQTGIGALTNSMAAPQMPQPEVMSESETISETGIANLPAPNVGNYAGGGIVGYADGGGVKPGFEVVRYTGPGTNITPYTGPGTNMVRYTGPGTNMTPYTGPGGTGAAAAAPWYKTLGKKALGLIPAIVRRHPVIAGLTTAGGLYSLLSGDEEEEAATLPKPTGQGYVQEGYDTTVTPGEVEEIPTEDIGTLGDYATERAETIRNIIGVDPNQARIEEKLRTMEERTTDREGQLGNDALIRAGIAMMGSKSPYFMQGLAEGAGAGMDSYTEGLDAVDAARAEQFTIDMELQKAQRQEQVAIATKGIESYEAKEASNRAIGLANVKARNDMSIAVMEGELNMKKAEMIYNTKGLLKDEDIIELYQTEVQNGRVSEDPKAANYYPISEYKQYLMENLGRMNPGGNIAPVEGFTATEITETVN